MRKIFLFIAMSLISLSINAQSETLLDSIPSLKGEKKINVQIDYTEMTINGLSQNDWIEFRNTAQPKYNATDELEKELKPQIKSSVVSEVNKKLMKEGAFAISNNTSNYTLVIKPISVDMKGNNSNECCIKDKEGNTLVTFTVKGKGGLFGSMSNLWSDGYKRTGKKIAEVLQKCFLK